MKKWTKEEIEHLEKVFPLLRTDELEVTFGRKYDTIRKKAAQVGCKRALRNKSITKRGIDLKPRKKKHSYLLEDTKKVLSDISKYIDMYYNGLSMREVSSIAKVSKPTMLKLFSISGVNWKDRSNAHRKYALNENFFDIIDNEEKAYYLGFIFADGFVSRSNNNFQLGIHLHKKDSCILEDFRKRIGSESPLKFDNRNAVKIRLYSKRLFEQLVSKGCVERKSLVLKFPEHTIVPECLIHHFIRGYFDGDGSIKRLSKSERHVQVEIVSTKEFLKTCMDILVKKAHVNYVSIYRPKNSNIYSITYSGKGNATKIHNYLYKNATIFLDRKKQRFIEYTCLSKIQTRQKNLLDIAIKLRKKGYSYYKISDEVGICRNTLSKHLKNYTKGKISSSQEEKLD